MWNKSGNFFVHMYIPVLFEHVTSSLINGLYYVSDKYIQIRKNLTFISTAGLKKHKGTIHAIEI